MFCRPSLRGLRSLLADQLWYVTAIEDLPIVAVLFII